MVHAHFRVWFWFPLVGFKWNLSLRECGLCVWLLVGSVHVSWGAENSRRFASP